MTHEERTPAHGRGTRGGGALNEELVPTVVLRQIARRYPKFWKHLDAIREAQAPKQRWPQWCFLPAGLVWLYLHEWLTGRRAKSLDETRSTAAGLHILAQTGQLEAGEPYLQVPLLAALASWRPTQGVYRFDADVLDALLSTAMAGEIPGEILEQLPEWCVYADLQDRAMFGGTVHGFFALLNRHQDTHARELMIIPMTSDHALMIVPVAPAPGEIGMMPTLTYEVAATIEESIEALDSQLPEAIQYRRDAAVLINLVLYLCSVAADVRDAAGKKARPSRPRPKRGSKLRVVGAQAPTTWEVGYRLGAALRAARSAAEGAGGGAFDRRGPVGHIRRAHWHTFWVGPRSDPERRSRQLRWLPPIPVNLDSEDELVPVVRRVD
jgi:hypothetical protein